MIKIITTNVAELLCVKVPENSYRHLFTNIHGDNDLVFYIKNEFPKFVTLPDGNYQLLGIAHGLTEEVWREILPPILGWSKTLYYNHQSKCSDYRDIVDSAFDKATESGLSLLRANEVYDVNPFEEKPCEKDYAFDGLINGEYDFNYDTSKWINAQQNTGNWLMLKKIDEV